MSGSEPEYPGDGPPFGATLERDDEWLVVRIRGELDLATVPILNEVFLDALSKRRPAIMLDLQDLTFLDSTGLQALVVFQLQATNDGADVKMRSVQAGPLKLLTLTGLAAKFGVSSSDGPASAGEIAS